MTARVQQRGSWRARSAAVSLRIAAATTVLTALLCGGAEAESGNVTRAPHILFVVMDDMGWSDPG